MPYLNKGNPLVNHTIVPKSETLMYHNAPHANPDAKPIGQEPVHELPGHQEVRGGIFEKSSQVSMREIKRTIEDKYLNYGVRKEMARKLNIGNPYDPRVSAELKKMIESIEDHNRDNRITRHEAEVSQGHTKGGMTGYYEVKHAKEDRLSDGVISYQEIKERKRSGFRFGLLEKIFGFGKRST